jgi:predicted TPR repeat methyltransferase
MSRSKDTLKYWGGSVLDMLVPWAVRGSDQDRHSGRFLRAKRWILYARSRRARAQGNAEALQKTLFDFWHADAADAYFDQYGDRFTKWFLGPHHEIVDQLAALSQTGTYTRLVEMGCGAGQVLEHCAEVLPEVQDFIGIDINPGIIARDQAHYAGNPRLTFLSADASVWLSEAAKPGTILLTYGGVMEYFAASTLSAIFAGLARQAPAAVALVEPVDPGHDLQNDPASHAFGQENSFSHNHEKLLQAAGFHTVFRKTLPLGGQSWVMLLAKI